MRWNPPHRAAWRHTTAREGFEVVFFATVTGGTRIRGYTSAVEDDAAWAVAYTIELDDALRTRVARVVTTTDEGRRTTTVSTDGDGHWRVDDLPAPPLDGLVDVDLEGSLMTNALPLLHRELAVGETLQAPAAYVRLDGTVVRLEQDYTRLPDGRTYAYRSPAYAFESTLTYDVHGLVLDYPGLGSRAA